ncbi:MAG: outer membrane beta-barrel protein [Gammaproteobacteria bacterium]|nr:outer membrane beta-barrel protein [Gammaproteobacteria bacterium]
MKNTHRSFPIAILLSGLIFMLTSGVVAKETGFYLQAGVTYWNDLEEPDVEIETEEGELPTEAEEFFTRQYEIDGSRSQLSIGGGYNFNENWGFEAFYVRSPEQNLSLNVDFPFDDFGIEESLSLSWTTTVQHTVLGVGAVYDLYLNQYLSLFGKAGIAFTQSSFDSNFLFSGQPLPEEEFPFGLLNQEEENQEVYGAIGMRVPLKLWLGSTDTSITFAYQFFETVRERETSFEIGFQWNF